MIDTHDILEARALTRDEAMRAREHLRAILRIWETAHSLPYSFQTKAEQGDLRAIGLHNSPAKEGHHNR